MADRWLTVGDTLDTAAAAWRMVSPESVGPLDELRADVKWSATYWRARGRGLSDVEATRETVQAVGEAREHYVNYEPDEGGASQ